LTPYVAYGNKMTETKAIKPQLRWNDKMEKLTNKITGAKTEMLLEMVRALNERFDDGVDLVLELTLNEIEKRLPVQEFIALCDSL
jgi:hypothetical protein